LPNNADEVIEHTNDDEIKTLLNNLQLQMRNYEDSKESLQNELFALQQNQIRQDEENRQLRQELAELKAQLHAISKINHNELNVNTDHQNDIYHDTEPSHSGCNERKSDQIQNTTHLPSTEVFADPNYDSSDNEDPRNDIYLD
jgi:chromosome segregation ATPase